MTPVSEELILRIGVIGGAVASAEVQSLNTRLAETEGAAGKASRGTSAFSSALKMMAPLVAGLGVVDAIKQFSAFQSQMERLKTQTGSTQAEVTSASKAILAMAVSVGTSPQSLAQALYHIESAGYRGQKAMDALKIAAEGAKIGGANLTDTTTAMTAVMVAGFKGVSTLKEAMGQLNAIVGAGDMTFQDLNDALGTGLLAALKVVGLQVKDAGAALAVLGDNNIRGAAAATRLRMGLMALVHPSSTATTALKHLGLTQLQLAEDLRKPNGLLVMFEDLKSHLHGLSKTQQAYDLAGVFGGGRNANAMETLLNNFDRLKTKYAEVQKGGKSFGDDWKATTKTLSFFVDQMKTLVEVVLIKAGPAILAVARGLKDFIAGLEHGKVWAEAIAAGITAIGVALIYAKIQAMDFAVASAALDAIPMVALFTAIGLAIMLLITHFKQVKAAALDAWHWIENGAKTVFNWLKQNWPLILVILMGPFGLLVDLIVGIFTGKIPGVVGKFVKWIGGVFGGLLKVLEWPFLQLWKGLTWIWDQIVSGVRWAAKEIGKALGVVLGPLKAVGHFIGGAAKGVGSAFSSIGSALGFADGGTVGASGSYLVGERGPEIVYLQKGSYVQPNHQINQPSSNGGQSQVLEATLVNVLDGRVLSRSVLRQGLLAQARRGSGGATLADAG